MWHLRNADSLNADLSCVADLTRHNKSVNVVRFSPNGNMMASADDGMCNNRVIRHYP